MLWNLLTDASESTSGNSGSNIGSYVLIIGLVLVIVLFMVLNNRSAKKRQQEQMKLYDSIKPGNKVKTIGGICGVVVEVNAEDNSIVVETGSEASGKSYIKFDKQAIYQTDAVAEDKKDEKTQEPAPETSETENVAAENEAPAEETSDRNEDTENKE